MKSFKLFPLIMLSLLVRNSVSTPIECDNFWYKEEGYFWFHNFIFNHEYKTGDIPAGRWPSYVTIYHRNNGAIDYTCGGTLMSHEYALTSKLCVINESGFLLNATNLLVRVGTHRQNVLNFGFAQFRAVSKINHQPSDTSKNELVLLEVKLQILYNNLVHPGCIRTDHKVSIKQEVGWGIEGTSVSVQIVLRNPEDCSSSFNLTKCCSNDRGSAVYENDAGTWYFKGIINCSKPFATITCIKNSNGFIALAPYMS